MMSAHVSGANCLLAEWLQVLGVEGYLQWGHVHRVLAKLVTVEFAALRFVMDGITWGSCACYCACWNRCKIAQAFMTGGNPPEIDNVAEISRQMSLQCNLHL